MNWKQNYLHVILCILLVLKYYVMIREPFEKISGFMTLLQPREIPKVKILFFEGPITYIKSMQHVEA